ncbi:inositol monophosphatase [Candidatus Woesearchaeota archaeon]|nr:inositol monophosphatase [Candidatus Woesearchaeota archaeon]
MIDLKQAETLAIRLAKMSGKILLDSKDKIKITEKKDKQDFCTNIDLKIEKFLIKEIHKVYPNHNILSEEIGDLKKKSDYLWVLDPIDGTKYYMKNVPLFTVSIALQYKDELVLGVVFDPSTNRVYHAYKDGGAYLDNKQIMISETNRLDHAFIYLDMSKIHHLSKNDKENALLRLNRVITETFRVRAFGLGSLGMCYLAQGAFDGFFDLTGTTKYVDVAAGIVIVREAGGHVSDLEEEKITRGSKHFFGTNINLKEKLRDLILQN